MLLKENSMVETVTIERFKSLDGYIYDSKKDAERADARWRAVNEFDLVNDIRKLEAGGQGTVLREERRTADRPGRYPVLVTLEMKHSTEYFMATKPDSLPNLYWDIFKLNYDYGCYNYEAASKAISEEIFKTENKFAAMTFVMQRAEYEYERIQTETLSVY